MSDTTQLSPDLAALLAAHGIAPTTDALFDFLASQEYPDCDGGVYSVEMSTQLYGDTCRATIGQSGSKPVVRFGPTPLTALARAYQAMVEEER